MIVVVPIGITMTTTVIEEPRHSLLAFFEQEHEFEWNDGLQSFKLASLWVVRVCRPCMLM